MDIHKPKSWHGWRDFLKEFVTIVLGVSVALAAEQGVEWWRWHNEVVAAREVLHEEIAGNNNRFFARRLAIASCLERQFREADAILSDLEAGRTPGKFTVYRYGSGSVISDAEWQSERASQVLTHFPRPERTLMSRYYASLPGFNDWIVTEGQAWRELTGLKKPLPGLTQSDLMHLRVSLQTARTMLNLINNSAPRMQRLGDQLGLDEPVVNASAVKSFCTMDDDHYYQVPSNSQQR
jgi:hypothetical protein